MMKWHTRAQRVNKTNTEMTKKRYLVAQVHTRGQISQQQNIQDDKHINTDQNKRIKVQAKGKQAHRSNQKNKGAYNRKIRAQIKTIEQRYIQEENTGTDKNKRIKTQTRGKHRQR